MGQELSEAFDDLDQFERQVDQMLHGVFPHQHRSRPRTWRPPTDVYETDDAVIVKIEIAGMNPEDLKISFVDRVLVVSGNRQDVDAKLSYHCLEIPYGEFQTEIALTGAYDEEAIEAKYENGFLRVTLPKTKGEHRVPIKVQSR
ncbi:MAG: Hsp20/alpha crystallin family protein [Chloroflexi bacterium]|nr:Hsp20/alpha crystallin family protein [Chloroflexota bacterium]